MNNKNKNVLAEQKKNKNQTYTHSYRWKNKVSLHGGKDAIEVNFFEYTMTNKSGEVAFKNSWVTDIEISQYNVKEMTRAGRCRWKIENECFNTLKNQDYHLEHNFQSFAILKNA